MFIFLYSYIIFKARTGDKLLVKISQFVFKECALRNEE